MHIRVSKPVKSGFKNPEKMTTSLHESLCCFALLAGDAHAHPTQPLCGAYTGLRSRPLPHGRRLQLPLVNLYCFGDGAIPQAPRRDCRHLALPVLIPAEHLYPRGTSRDFRDRNKEREQKCARFQRVLNSMCRLPGRWRARGISGELAPCRKRAACGDPPLLHRVMPCASFI